MIPHVIHYCWFGHNTKSKIIRKCLATWKDIYPDWEIIEWNEDNYDVNKIPYIKEAYQQKKWAFVCDYARFDILDQYGGVFLDTDVEMLKRLPEEFLNQEGFTGFEAGGKVAPGLIYASVPHQKMLQMIKEEYESRSCFSMDGTVCDVLSNILFRCGLVNNGEIQVINGLAVYPEEYFCAFKHETQLFTITDHTYCIHHYVASWVPWYKKIKYKTIRLVNLVIGEKAYRRIKKVIKRFTR